MLITGRTFEIPLISNGYVLESTADRLGWLTPSSPDTSIETLRLQYQEQGYLWLKGILDRNEVLSFRRRYFSAFNQTGLLKKDTDPGDGIYSGGSYDKEVAHKMSIEIVRWATYEAFCLAKPIVEFYEAFLQSPVYLHKRKLIRFNRPGEQSVTGGHYDQIYLRAGTDQFCSSWIPIGDTPVEMGGLVYLENSVAIGKKFESDYQAHNANLPNEKRIQAYKNGQWDGWLSENLPALAEQHNTRWLMADYEAGDMVIHDPYILHASTVNQDLEGRMRLSTDIRYQRISDPIDKRWNNHWSPDDNL